MTDRGPTLESMPQSSPRKLTVAIDGPAGSGKSSVAQRVAQILGYLYLDSGAMYRAFALKALQDNGIALSSERQLADLAETTTIELKATRSKPAAEGVKNRVLLDGIDVTQAIRTPEV